MMNKVILYENPKSAQLVFDVSTEEKRKEAYRQLFETIDKYKGFFFSKKRAEERLDRLQNPEIEYEDSVMVESNKEGYVKKISKEKWRDKIESTKEEISSVQEKQKTYESAKKGDIESIRSILNTVKGQPYADFRELEIQNQ